MVGNSFEFFLVPAYDGELIVDRRLLLRMLPNVLFHLIASYFCRIESASRRHDLAADKGFLLLQQVEARSINPQIAPQLQVAEVPIRCQRLIKRQTLGIALPPIDAFEVAAGLHQFANQLLLASAQTIRPKRHWNAPELRQALRQVRYDS